MTDSYVRQKRLKEIGDSGQLTLGRAQGMIPTGFATGPAQEYLRRSGLGSVVLGDDPGPEFKYAGYFQFDVCRNYAAGAWLATQMIVDVLGLSLGSRNAKESL